MFIKIYDENGLFDGYWSIEKVDSFSVEYFEGDYEGDDHFQLAARDEELDTLFYISTKLHLGGREKDGEMEKAEKLLDKIMKEVNQSK
jgi:hypothetical protein